MTWTVLLLAIKVMRLPADSVINKVRRSFLQTRTPSTRVKDSSCPLMRTATACPACSWVQSVARIVITNMGLSPFYLIVAKREGR